MNGDDQKEFYHVGDTPCVISGQTDLVSALNAWGADHNNDAGTSYRMWTLEENGVPSFTDGEWSDSCAGSLTERDGVIVIRTPEELAWFAVEEYSIDPYTDVSGIYDYYWGIDGLSVQLGDSVSVIVASFDASGRLENIEVFTQAGKYTVSPDAETAEVRIIAVGDTAWIPLCEMLSFAV